MAGLLNFFYPADPFRVFEIIADPSGGIQSH